MCSERGPQAGCRPISIQDWLPSALVRRLQNEPDLAILRALIAGEALRHTLGYRTTPALVNAIVGVLGRSSAEVFDELLGLLGQLEGGLPIGRVEVETRARACRRLGRQATAGQALRVVELIQQSFLGQGVEASGDVACAEALALLWERAGRGRGLEAGVVPLEDLAADAGPLRQALLPALLQHLRRQPRTARLPSQKVVEALSHEGPGAPDARARGRELRELQPALAEAAGDPRAGPGVRIAIVVALATTGARAELRALRGAALQARRYAPGAGPGGRARARHTGTGLSDSLIHPSLSLSFSS
jgi:hypothetical protein